MLSSVIDSSSAAVSAWVVAAASLPPTLVLCGYATSSSCCSEAWDRTRSSVAAPCETSYAATHARSSCIRALLSAAASLSLLCFALCAIALTVAARSVLSAAAPMVDVAACPWLRRCSRVRTWVAGACPTASLLCLAPATAAASAAAAARKAAARRPRRLKRRVGTLRARLACGARWRRQQQQWRGVGGERIHGPAAALPRSAVAAGF